jgi:hypothetical protein
LSDYFNHQLGHPPHAGDNLPLGTVALIAHTVEKDQVVTVGLQLAEPDPMVARTRLSRASQTVREAAKRLLQRT